MFGGKLVSYDEAKIAGMPGVKKVVKVNDSAVAVVADTWWQAKTALDALPIVWDEGAERASSSATIAEHLRRPRRGQTTNGERQGRRRARRRSPARRRRSRRSTRRRSSSHASMEPMNCTVKLTADKAEVLGADAERRGLARRAVGGVGPAARASARSTSTTSAAASAGAAASQDYVRQAVAIAKQFPGTPVKMIWSREEDMAHDFFRPISQCKLSAGLDADGNLVGLHVRVSGQSINAFLNPGRHRRRQGPPPAAGLLRRAAATRSSATPCRTCCIEYAMRNTHVPVGPWRGVNTNQNGVYMECFIDEVARAAGKDPLEFRRALMQQPSQAPRRAERRRREGRLGQAAAGRRASRHRAVHGLRQLLGRGRRGVGEPEGQGQGPPHGAGARTAATRSIPTRSRRRSKARSPTACPRRSTANARSRTAASTELNFDTYQLLRLAEMPKVETVIVPTYDFWGGVGEPTICVVAPAVLNAIYAATGKPVRSLPLKNVKLV